MIFYMFKINMCIYIYKENSDIVLKKTKKYIYIKLNNDIV